MRRLLGIVFITSLALMDSALGSSSCPTRQYSGACIQVITFALNPETGECCVYPNPCAVPEGWETSFSGCPSTKYCNDTCSPVGAHGVCIDLTTGKKYNCLCGGTWDCFEEA